MTKELPAHSVIRPLNVKDLEQVLALEKQTFNDQEGCTKESAQYRLRSCPELCAGVFIRKFKQASAADEQQQPQEQPEQEHIEDRDEDYEDISEDEEDDEMELPKGTSSLESEELIGHILSTKCSTEFITDEAMGIPDLDEYGRIKDPKADKRGHREEGRTIAIHSLAVSPGYQGQSIGTILLRDYIQRITTQHIADRMSLLAHDELVPFYERFGFKDEGESKCHHGGVTWRDCWLPLSDTDDEEDDE